MSDLECAQDAAVKQLMRREGGSPDVGGSRPAITLKSVVLPAPFGPIRPVILPFSKERVTPSTARKPPKWRWRLSTRIIGTIYKKPERGCARAFVRFVRSAEGDGFVRTALNNVFTIRTSRLARPNQLHTRCADIINIAARFEDLNRFA